MRRPLIIALVLSTLTGLSQTADYFAGNPEWRQSTSCAVPYPCIETREFVYYLNGDTVLNGNSYHILFRRGESTYFYSEPNPPGNCTGSEVFDLPVGYLRQSGKRILKFDGFGQPDDIVYDFEMEIGDTIPMTANINIQDIDTIEFAGESRLRFWLNGAESEHLIEGIGHNLGFLLPIQSDYLECGYSFYCFKQFSDTLQWSNNIEGCDFTVDVQEAKFEAGKVYPNPCVDELIIELSNLTEVLEVIACDINGR